MRRRVALLVAGASISLQANANEVAPTEEVCGATVPAIVDIVDAPIELERMGVTTLLSRALIRHDLYAAQARVYELFNELNSNDDYDMVCQQEARLGSQIKYRVCKPRFQRKAESEASQEMLEGYEDDVMAHVNGATMKRQAEHQLELMADLANSNPGFLALLKRRLELRKAYEAAGGK